MKPFQIVKHGRRWELFVLGPEIVQRAPQRAIRKAQGMPDRAILFQQDRTPLVRTDRGLGFGGELDTPHDFGTKADAQRTAHQIARYMFDMGDFVDSYTETATAPRAGAGAFDGAGDYDPSAVAELHEHTPGAGYYLARSAGAGGFFDDDDERAAARKLLDRTYTRIPSGSADWGNRTWRVSKGSSPGEGVFISEGDNDDEFFLVRRTYDEGTIGTLNAGELEDTFEDEDLDSGSLAQVLLAAKKRSGGAGGLLGAGLDFTVSKEFADTVLPPPKREGLPERPPVGASPEEWNAYFTRMTQRTRELVERQNAAVQAEIDRDAAIAGKAVGEVLGETIGNYVRDFYRWSSRAGMAIGRFFSGGDPGWNDPAWIEAALARASHLAEQGYASPPPYAGATRAETEDAIDWEGNLRDIERRMSAFWERHPEEAAGVDAAIRWGKSNPDHPGQTAIVHSGAWPIPLENGRPGISDLGIVAIARELALANGKDPDWMTAAAFQHLAMQLAEDSRIRKSGEALNIDAAGYYGTDYLFGDLLAAIVRSIPDAPEAFTPDLMLAPFAASPGASSGGASEGGGAAIAAGLGLAAILFL